MSAARGRPPPPRVLAAFNVSGCEPVPLADGRGLSFLLKGSGEGGCDGEGEESQDEGMNDVVLKPVDDAAEYEFMVGVFESLTGMKEGRERGSRGYRIAEPVRASEIASATTVMTTKAADVTATGAAEGVVSANGYIVDGWTASRFLTGTAGAKGRWNELLTASRALHRDLADLVKTAPAFLTRRRDRWVIGDRLAWEEESMEDLSREGVVNREYQRKITPWLERLKRVRLPVEAVNQLVHGDLTGNVLFDGERVPGIIDFSPYWRPVAYAEGIVAVDAVLLHGEGEEVVQLVASDRFRRQMLVRALFYRIATFAIQTDERWVATMWSFFNFEGVVEIVSKIACRDIE